MPASSWEHWFTVAETAAASELGREIPCDMLREELEGVKTCVCLWVLEVWVKIQALTDPRPVTVCTHLPIMP